MILIQLGFQFLQGMAMGSGEKKGFSEFAIFTGMMYCLSQVVQFIICSFLSPALCAVLKVGAWNMDIP